MTKFASVFRASLSVAMASLLTLALPAYSADDASARAKEHERQMTKGKDHFDAQRAAHQEENAAAAQARGKTHERAMQKGKDHFDAQRASQRESNPEEVQAKAKAHERAMMKGKDHADGWRAGDAVQDATKPTGK